MSANSVDHTFEEENINKVDSSELLHSQSQSDDEVQVPDLQEDEYEEDDDFGSFDEASFEEFQEPEPERHPEETKRISLSSQDFLEAQRFLDKVDEILDSVFPEIQHREVAPTPLLKAEASQKLITLSRAPRLNPPNWIKLKIRHNLLIKLGVPINLDELESPNTINISATANITHNRRRSINEQDLKWEQYHIPEVETFNLTSEQKQELVGKTAEVLSKIEEDNLNNTSQLFLENSLESTLDMKLAQMKANYDQLIKLSAVWQDQMKELRNSQEIYESVVQNMVGYSQKLQRNEIIEHLQKTKGKKGKRTF
ncbi:CIC11C00000001761 [Sungouiella intermedia]|uniref:CIC11C00000001761 n=1 Tax=Sungouiella intermedia TaxID=45354 RepID=A0A1L0BMW4_9ASCO|nr:CIC11C00000001761 [[Candida] intermedia]